MNNETQYQLLSIEELRELAKTDQYRPKDEDKDYPLELLRDDETGDLYTEYFADGRTDMLLSHLLVEQMYAAFDNVDWWHVTKNFNPYIIARICSLYRYPLRWIDVPEEWKGKYIFSGQICTEIYDASREDENLKELTDILVPNYHVAEFLDDMPILAIGENSDLLLDRPIHDWRIFLADWNALNKCEPNSQDPYFTNEAFPIFERKIFSANIALAREYGVKKVLKLIQILRDEWKYIKTLRLFGYQEDDKDVKEFEHFLFEELDLYTSGWNIEDEPEESPEEKSEERPKDKPEGPKDYSSPIFTKKAKMENKQKEIIDSLEESMDGVPDKARALVKEMESWQNDGYLDENFKATIYHRELLKFIDLPFSYNGFRKYFYENRPW